MIRSITIGIPIFNKSDNNIKEELIKFKEVVNNYSLKKNLSIRTMRLTLPPINSNNKVTAEMIYSIIQSTKKIADSIGVRWYCLPIDLFIENNRKEILEEIQNLLIKDSRLFINLIVANKNSISIEGAELASQFILNTARRSANGIDNFRVGTSASCEAGTPFFPFSRHEGKKTNFSIALETTSIALKLANKAYSNKWTLSEFHKTLVYELSEVMITIDNFGKLIEDNTGLEYLGLDGSFAPFPDGETSVSKIIEALGPTPSGVYGSVFITSILTDALKKAGKYSKARTIGFNGVMFSVLEDNGMANANNLKALTLEKLALLSTVCGCGIDMAPVPMSMFQEDISSLILDISTLAVKLNKPLGVRILPIPNKSVNEYTQLNLDFLCDSRVMDSGVSASKPMLFGKTWSYDNQILDKGNSND